MSKKILVVDDEPNMLRLGEYALKLEGYEILTAENGATALNRIQTEHPDLAILDVMLPDISGIDALKLLASDPETARIPVIALSANAMLHDIQKGKAAGFFRYLTKPVNVNELMTTLDSALDSAQAQATRGVQPGES